MSQANTQPTLTDPELLRTQCYINGAYVGVSKVAVHNPATGQEIARVPNLGADAATEAVEAASRAFPGWSRRTAKDRGALLRRWFELIRENREDLARLLTCEQGKPLTEALAEIDYGASYVEFYAEEAKRIAGEILPSHRGDARILVQRQAAGVAAAITPWNFPNAMITRKVAPALAAGCTVVIKPAMETPLSALALAELAHRAGLPAGVLNVVTGDAKAIGEVFCTHPAVRVLGFTGSTEVGKLLMQQCASTVKHVALELGGNAPFLVFDDADVEAAVEGAMASKFRNAGQTCVCTNRFYVQAGIYDAFMERLIKATGQLKLGNGLEAGVTQGPLINDKAVDKVERHIADALARGARLRLGGKRDDERGLTYFQPTVLADVPPDALMTQEETFGPVAPVIRFSTEEEALSLANASSVGLASYVYTRDLGRAFRVSEALEFGMVGINTGLISTELAPFGGIKESGNGREGSHHGVDEYLEMKYLLVAGL